MDYSRHWFGIKREVEGKKLRFDILKEEEVEGKYRFHHPRRYDSKFKGTRRNPGEEPPIYDVEWQSEGRGGTVGGTITFVSKELLEFDQGGGPNRGTFKYKPKPE